MMVMMMSLLVRISRSVALTRVSIANDQFRTISFDVGAAVAIVVSVTGLVECLLTSQRRVIRACAGRADFLTGRRLVKIFPSLTIVAVQTTSTTRRSAVETRDGVAVGRGSMPIVLASSTSVSARDENVLVL